MRIVETLTPSTEVSVRAQKSQRSPLGPQSTWTQESEERQRVRDPGSGTSPTKDGAELCWAKVFPVVSDNVQGDEANLEIILR